MQCQAKSNGEGRGEGGSEDAGEASSVREAAEEKRGQRRRDVRSRVTNPGTCNLCRPARPRRPPEAFPSVGARDKTRNFVQVPGQKTKFCPGFPAQIACPGIRNASAFHFQQKNFY